MSSATSGVRCSDVIASESGARCATSLVMPSRRVDHILSAS